MTTTPIGDYAAIGDGRSIALVSRDGAVDWLCWPRPDSPALFARLLGEGAGTFRVGPAGPARSSRRYEPDTNVLCTLHEDAGGAVRVTDAMTVASEREASSQLLPEHELIRRVEGVRGRVAIEVRFDPRPAYGSETPRLVRRGALGWRVEQKRELYTLRADLPLEQASDGSLRARAIVRAGETLCFALTADSDLPAVLPPPSISASEGIERTLRWWRGWARRCSYQGPYREAVVRSLLALKLLIYSPSGAVLAAATTSLPEKPGGALNWDYRYCWLRDAALTVNALSALGYADEAGAFTSWLLHSTRLTRPELHVLYDVFGRRPRDERELSHLGGWGGATPVRIGNGASEQTQLDVYGEVVDAAARVALASGELDRDTRRMLCDFGRYVCEHWHLPDSGIWEPRGEPQHYTHSRVMCWVTLDRLITLYERGLLSKAPVELFRRNRERIRREVEDRGFHPTLRAYTQTLDGDRLDAAALMLGWHGFHEPDHPRMRSTYDAIVDRLDAGGGLLYRYEQSVDAGEGAFGICSFWAAHHLARGGGTLHEAEHLFERLLRYANDLGLYAEEIDPRTGAHLGNFPQAFTHVGLLDAALSIERRRAAGERETGSERPADARAEALEAAP